MDRVKERQKSVRIPSSTPFLKAFAYLDQFLQSVNNKDIPIFVDHHFISSSNETIFQVRLLSSLLIVRITKSVGRLSNPELSRLIEVTVFSFWIDDPGFTIWDDSTGWSKNWSQVGWVHDSDLKRSLGRVKQGQLGIEGGREESRVLTVQVSVIPHLWVESRNRIQKRHRWMHDSSTSTHPWPQSVPGRRVLSSLLRSSDKGAAPIMIKLAILLASFRYFSADGSLHRRTTCGDGFQRDVSKEAENETLDE